MEDKRRFIGSICVRSGTKRCKIELAEAEDYGGEPGFYRLRVDRRWFDGPGSRPAYFDRAQLAALVAELASGAQPGELRPENAPDLPRNSLVSVKFWHNDWPQTEATRTSTPPIRAHDGRWYVGVVTMAAGFLFLPVADVKLRPDPRARRVTQAKPQKTAA